MVTCGFCVSSHEAAKDFSIVCIQSTLSTEWLGQIASVLDLKSGVLSAFHRRLIRSQYLPVRKKYGKVATQKCLESVLGLEGPCEVLGAEPLLYSFEL